MMFTNNLIFMIKRYILFPLAALLILVPIQLSASDPVIKIRKKQMSEQVFQSVLPKLQKLAPGDDLSSIKKMLKAGWITSKNGKRSPMVHMPGWINSMSGGVFGGLSMGGGLFAKSGQLINGRHVFGYVWGKLNLVPQFEIITQATMIDKIEYDRLDSRKTNGIGIASSELGKVYFKGLRVLKTRTLPFRGRSDVEGRAARIKPFKKNKLPPFYTEQAFQDAKEKLLRLNKGTDLWEMLKELGALFMTTDYGENHSFLVNGFLNYKNARTQHIETDEALYILRPFGYIQNNKEVIKLIVIFKNGLLEKVTPYSGAEDWHSYLTD